MKFLIKCSGVFVIKISNKESKSITYGSYFVSNNFPIICAICFGFIQISIYSFVDVLLKDKTNLIKLLNVEQDDLLMILSTMFLMIFLHKKS